MKPASLLYAFIIGVTSLLSLPVTTFAASPAAIDAMEEYFDFSEYGGATILPEQIPAEDWKKIHVIDTRDAEQFQREHIPGALNIEWRQVLGRRAELPGDKMVLLYCNSGTLSAQAGFALRVAGMSNVRILQGGFTEWKVKGGFKANQIASEKSAR